MHKACSPLLIVRRLREFSKSSVRVQLNWKCPEKYKLKKKGLGIIHYTKSEQGYLWELVCKRTCKILNWQTTHMGFAAKGNITVFPTFICIRQVRCQSNNRKCQTFHFLLAFREFYLFFIGKNLSAK